MKDYPEHNPPELPEGLGNILYFEDVPDVKEEDILGAITRYGDDWQPLANSPRDGTVFMAYVSHDDPRAGGFQFAAVWNLRDRLLCMMSGDDFTNKATLWRVAFPFPENV
jgi:hypothetical protein